MLFSRKKKADLGSRLKQLFKLGSGQEEFYHELEELFLEGDLGPRFTLDLIMEIRSLAKKERLKNPEQLQEVVRERLFSTIKTAELRPPAGQLSCYLLLGVNGVGKTTSIAKLANWYRNQGISKRIVLAAGDTFRAAATEQLITHGERLGFRVVSQGAGADPGAVLFDAIESAKARGDELVLADTAGRLQNKAHLVKELQKIDKIVASKIPVENYKKILVLDATTGQNGFQQAQVFHEALGVDGIILSKYDSGARGGMAIGISRDLGIPFVFLGTGEKMEDFGPFEARQFAEDLSARIL